jgi:SAM-dependent methyltransferase
MTARRSPSWSQGVPPSWKPIVAHYEATFACHGPSPQGVDWPDGRDLEARFSVQLEIAAAVPPGRPIRLLDVGCGPGLLIDYIRQVDCQNAFEYVGIDLSPTMVEAASRRWPDYEFYVHDLTSNPTAFGLFDVAIMNGVLTERVSLTEEQMGALARRIVRSAYEATTVGLAFNVMSKHVDFERSDLFHWGFDEVAGFLKDEVTRHFDFRSAYGLYEYTVHAWHEYQRPPPLDRQEWWNR